MNDSTIAKIIYEDFVKAYHSRSKEDINKAMNTVKLVLDGNNEPIPGVISELRRLKITAVWNKVINGVSTDIRLGLKYKDMAIEI